MSVRPEGYYPKPFKAPRRSAKKKTEDPLQEVLSLLPRLDVPALAKVAAAVADAETLRRQEAESGAKPLAAVG
jgi:hypothetical protein